MADWLGRDEDTVARINDLLSGQRTERYEGSYGPVFGSYSESYPRTETPWWERQPEPTRQGSINYVAPLGPAMVMGGVSGETKPGGRTSVYPNVGVVGGPINLRAGLEHYTEPGYSHTRPNFGMGVGVPLGNKGSASADFSVTPGFSKSLGAALNYRFSPEAVISALIRRSMQDRGGDDTEAGVAFNYKFPAPRRVNEYERQGR